jgi:hypothetical protein
LEAWLAGYSPKKIPTDVDTQIATMIEIGSTLEGIDVASVTIRAIKNPRRIPIIPPTVEITAASIRN